MQRSIEVSPGCMCALLSTTEKIEEGLLVLFLGFGLSIDPSLEIFLSTPLQATMAFFDIFHILNLYTKEFNSVQDKYFTGSRLEIF